MFSKNYAIIAGMARVHSRWQHAYYMDYSGEVDGGGGGGQGDGSLWFIFSTREMPMFGLGCTSGSACSVMAIICRFER